MKLHERNKIPSSQPMQPLGPFPIASALSAGGTAMNVPCAACPSVEQAVRSLQWGASTKECGSEGMIFFSLFKELKTFPQSLVIEKNTRNKRCHKYFVNFRSSWLKDVTATSAVTADVHQLPHTTAMVLLIDWEGAIYSNSNTFCSIENWTLSRRNPSWEHFNSIK